MKQERANVECKFRTNCFGWGDFRSSMCFVCVCFLMKNSHWLGTIAL